jgi:hypothetical protein
MESMKTTVDIPEEELREAMRLTQAKTKKEAIVTAITEFNRRRKLDWLAAQMGTFNDFLSQEDLRSLREGD